MARIKAPKTLNNFLKKMYNTDLTINENFNIKMFRNNYFDSPDDVNFYGKVNILKSIRELEIIYNEQVSGKKEFFSGFDSTEEKYIFVIYNKSLNKYDDPINIRRYEISNQILKDYIISLKNKKQVNSVNRPNRFKIMEIE